MNLTALLAFADNRIRIIDGDDAIVLDACGPALKPALAGASNWRRF